ncbi:hypothetical protein Fmac_017727 [Flemingia macrophylla]|uniref:CAND6/7 N-terminal domain-containing protein n=1 Tax=Flemingia macrophylla TaxID=520843 RepID=A0ABD1M2Y6_9FABA
MSRNYRWTPQHRNGRQEWLIVVVVKRLGRFEVLRYVLVYVLQLFPVGSQLGHDRIRPHNFGTSFTILRLFTFIVLSPPPSSSFNSTYPVTTTSNEYSLFFINCNPDTVVSMSLRTELFNLNPTHTYLSSAHTHLPSLFFLFSVAYFSFFAFSLSLTKHLIIPSLFLANTFNLLHVAALKHCLNLAALLALPTISSSSSLASPALFCSSRHASFTANANHAHSLRLSVHSRRASPEHSAAAAVHQDLNRTGSHSFPPTMPKEKDLLSDTVACKARYVDIGFEGDDRGNRDGSRSFKDVSEKIGFRVYFTILIKLYEV